MKGSIKNIVLNVIIIVVVAVIWCSSSPIYLAGKSVEIGFQLTNSANNENASMISSGVKGVVHFLGLECPPNIPTRTPPCSGPYPNYEVTAYSDNCNTVVGTTKSDSAGEYYLALRSGNYTISTQTGLNPSEFQCDSIVIKQGILVKDLYLDTGIR
jgi:hypothetical protein